MKKFLLLVFVISFALIISASFNYGLTRFYLAIPFMLYALVYAYKSFKNKTVTLVIFVFCTLSIAINLTLEKNELVFPILKKGEIIILKDTNFRKYVNDEGLSVIIPDEAFNCTGCPKFEDFQLKEAQRFHAKSIKVSHPDFSTRVSVLTEVGAFSEDSLRVHAKNIIATKNIQSPFYSKLGALMYYPIFPALIPSIVWSLFPDVEIIIKDDASNKRVAYLNYSIARSRNVKKGDEVFLNCSSKIKHSSGLICSLEFSGFDYGTTLPKNNPLYGVYTPMTVVISADGIPDKSVLKY